MQPYAAGHALARLAGAAVMDRLPLRAPVLLVAVLAAVPGAVPAIGRQSEGDLRDRIDSQRSREQSLASSLARLGRLERATAREVAILEKRVGAVQAQLSTAESVLASTEQRRNRQRARALRLRARLTRSREKLATLLRERYTGARPDVITVVLHSDGFAQLLETVDFLRTDPGAGSAHPRHGPGRAARRAVAAPAADAAYRAERSLTRLLAQRARALKAVGPGGPWAIPWPVVQCESGGQNLGPNFRRRVGLLSVHARDLARARRLDAARAPRLEGRAGPPGAKLWDGGRGAHNWVCASLIGLI